MYIYFQHKTNKRYSGIATDYFVGDNKSIILAAFREIHPELWAWLGE